MGETVEEADDHENQRVRDHDDLVAEPVYDLAHQRRGEEAAHRRQGEQRADDHGVRAVEQDEHIGAEGEENLLARAVKHFQHVILGVFPAEVETAFIFVRGALARHAQAGDEAEADDARADGEGRAVKPGGVPDEEKRRDDHEVAGQRADLLRCVLQAQRLAAAPRAGILQRERVAHAQLHVVAEGIDEDAQDDQHASCGHDGLRGHAGEHKDRAEPVDALRGEGVEDSQDEHQQQPRQFPEKLGDALVEAGHAHDFRQIVVDDALVQPVGQPDGDDRQEKGPESGFGPEYRAQPLHHGLIVSSYRVVLLQVWNHITQVI